MELDAVYDALASGSADPGDLSWTRRRLQSMALERAKTGDVAQRLGALRVAASLGPKDGIPVVLELVKDSDRQIRTWAVHQAVGARDQGIVALRTALDGTDPEVVRVALEHLGRWVDASSIPAVRRALQSADPVVRRLAVDLLGNVGGTVVRADLERLRRDPDEPVREAVEVAIKRLSGALPKAVRNPWWDDTPPPEAAPPPAPAPAPAPPAPEPAPVAPLSIPGLVFHSAPSLAAPEPAPEAPKAAEASPGQSAASAPEIVYRTTPVPDALTPPAWGPDATALVPTAPAEKAAVAATTTDPAWDGRAAALPAVLPTETRALVKLLGMVSDADRAAILPKLDGPAARKDFGGLLLGAPPADVGLARGLAITAGALGGPAHVTALRPYLKHADRGVRLAALHALGRIGTPASVPWLTALLADPDLRVAATQALGALGKRVRPDLVRDALSRQRTEDPEWRAALDEALAGVRP